MPSEIKRKNGLGARGREGVYDEGTEETNTLFLIAEKKSSYVYSG